jgi:uncharacterized protein involved in exopolysaccharide biosynthesis
MDKHPRIARLQETIAGLEQQCAASLAGNAGKAPLPRRTGDTVEANPVYQNLKIQYNAAELDLGDARTQLATSQKTVAQLHRDVDKITEVEAQLKQLNRDYDVVQGRHQELLKRWEDLMAKERLDPVSDTGLFQRIEPPFALADPVGPQRPALLSGLLLLALAAGLAVAFVLNQLHPVYFTRNSLGKATPFPVLGSISMIPSPGSVARRRTAAIAWGAACLTLFFACGIAIRFALEASAWLRALTGGGIS